PGRIKNGDNPKQGPAAELHYAADIARIQALGLDSYRLGIEWSRLFPTKEAFLAEPPSPDAAALAYYHAVLATMRSACVRPMVTLLHFTLPIWLQDPLSAAGPRGLLDPDFVPLATRFASWAAGELGAEVDYWNTINEPSGIAGGGYVDGAFPPGHVLDLD